MRLLPVPVIADTLGMTAPSPFESAVSTLLAALPEEDSKVVCEASNDDLLMHNLELGMWIRNNLGLWRGNIDLKAQMVAVGVTHEDDMSVYIMAGARAVLNGRSAESALEEKIFEV